MLILHRRWKKPTLTVNAIFSCAQITTRTVLQIRTHAQKYFNKLNRNKAKAEAAARAAAEGITSSASKRGARASSRRLKQQQTQTSPISQQLAPLVKPEADATPPRKRDSDTLTSSESLFNENGSPFELLASTFITDAEDSWVDCVSPMRSAAPRKRKDSLDSPNSMQSRKRRNFSLDEGDFLLEPLWAGNDEVDEFGELEAARFDCPQPQADALAMHSPPGPMDLASLLQEAGDLESSWLELDHMEVTGPCEEFFLSNSSASTPSSKTSTPISAGGAWHQ